MNVISFDDMYAGDCVEALYEASQSLKDYVEIDSYSEIFESENPEVKEKIDNNKAVVEKTDNAILRAIKALKNLISRIINSITDFFKKLGMDKGERDAFEQFKEACKQDPSLKNKKITVNDYRKVIANYDEMIKELEATDRDLAMKKETPFQTIQRKIQEKLSQTVQSVGTLVTSQIAYDMARDNKSAARAIGMLLKSDNTVLDKLEKDLGTAQTKKYVKDIQCLGKRVSIRRFIINIRHKQCKCLLDTLKTTTNSFVDLLHGRVTADNARMAKRVLDNDNVGGAIKGAAKTVATATGKGAGGYVKDLVKEKIKSKTSKPGKYVALKNSPPQREEGESEFSYKQRKAEWQKKVDMYTDSEIYGKKVAKFMSKKPVREPGENKEAYEARVKEFNDKLEKLQNKGKKSAADKSIVDYIFSK